MSSITAGSVPVVSSTELRRLQNVPSRTVAPDAGIASYFVWLRRHTGLSIHQTAALLQTEAEVIDALEAGAISELPAWPETLRVVRAYAALAGVDATAPLNALHARWPKSPAKSPSPPAPNTGLLTLKLW